MVLVDCCEGFGVVSDCIEDHFVKLRFGWQCRVKRGKQSDYLNFSGAWLACACLLKLKSRVSGFL